jgi:hypothetical protein
MSVRLKLLDHDLVPPRATAGRAIKKNDVAEYLAMFCHVGLLSNKPPGTAGLPFV